MEKTGNRLNVHPPKLSCFHTMKCRRPLKRWYRLIWSELETFGYFIKTESQVAKESTSLFFQWLYIFLFLKNFSFQISYIHMFSGRHCITVLSIYFTDSNHVDSVSFVCKLMCMCFLSLFWVSLFKFQFRNKLWVQVNKSEGKVFL